jgi:hypothetical protein
MTQDIGAFTAIPIEANISQAPITTIQLAMKPKDDAVVMEMRCFLTGYFFSGTD